MQQNIDGRRVGKGLTKFANNVSRKARYVVDAPLIDGLSRMCTSRLAPATAKSPAEVAAALLCQQPLFPILRIIRTQRHLLFSFLSRFESSVASRLFLKIVPHRSHFLLSVKYQSGFVEDSNLTAHPAELYHRSRSELPA